MCSICIGGFSEEPLLICIDDVFYLIPHLLGNYIGPKMAIGSNQLILLLGLGLNRCWVNVVGSYSANVIILTSPIRNLEHRLDVMLSKHQVIL